MTVEETIIEASTNPSPTGGRYVAKAYPKDTSLAPLASKTNGSMNRPGAVMDPAEIAVSPSADS